MRLNKPHSTLIAITALLSSNLASAAPQKAEELYNEAQAYLADSEYKSAVIQLKNALLEAPDYMQARLLLAETYLTLGDAPSAEKEYKRARTLGAPAQKWKPGLAKAYLQQAKYRELLQDITADKEATPEARAALLVLRGEARVGLKDYAEAEGDFSQALELKPDSSGALLGMARLARARNDYEKAFTLTSRAIEQARSNSEALQLRAEVSERKGDLEQAAADYTRAIEADPRNLKALIGRATVLIKMGLDQKALADLNAYDTARPGSPVSSYLHALVAFRSGDLETATNKLEQTLRVAPTHYQSQVLYGTIKFIQGQLETANEFLSQAHEHNPGHVQLTKLLAATKLRLKQPEAAVALLAGPAETTKDAQLLGLLGSAYMMQGNYNASSQAYSRALEIAPDVAGLKANLAIGLLQSGGEDEAIGELESAVDLAKNDVPLDPLLVLAKVQQGQYDAALKIAESFAQRDQDNPMAFNLKGIVQLARQDLDQAEASFQHAVDIDPKFYEAKINLSRIDLMRGNPGSARERYQSILADKPNHFGALLGMIALAVQDKNTAEVERWVKRTRELYPNAVQPGLLLTNHYLETGQSDKATETAIELQSQFPDNPVVLNTLVRAQQASGATNSALDNLEAIVRQQPDNTMARLILAEAYLNANKLYAARKAYETVIEQKPNLIKAHVGLASIEMSSHHPDKAIEIAKHIQDIAPDAAEGYRLEGIVQYGQHNYAAAAKALQQAYAKQPSAQIARILAAAYQKQDNTQAAARTLSAWLDESPDDIKTRRQLALLLHGSGKVEAAQKEYEILVDKQQKPDPIVLNNLASIYFTSGNPKALATAKQAYQLTENAPDIMDTYGWILFNHGEINKGLSLLQDALVRAPHNDEIRLHVAIGLSKTGNRNEARQELQKLLDGPYAEKARQLLDDLDS